MKSTEAMLTEFLANKDESEVPYQVEMNLREFANFINQMSARQAVLEQAAFEIDTYLDKTAKKKKLMQIEISDLENFRNQLIMDNRVTFTMLGDKNSLARLSSFAGAGSDLATADDAMSKH